MTVKNRRVWDESSTTRGYILAGDSYVPTEFFPCVEIIDLDVDNCLNI